MRTNISKGKWNVTIDSWSQRPLVNMSVFSERYYAQLHKGVLYGWFVIILFSCYFYLHFLHNKFFPSTNSKQQCFFCHLLLIISFFSWDWDFMSSLHIFLSFYFLLIIYILLHNFFFHLQIPCKIALLSSITFHQIYYVVLFYLTCQAFKYYSLFTFYLHFLHYFYHPQIPYINALLPASNFV